MVEHVTVVYVQRAEHTLVIITTFVGRLRDDLIVNSRAMDRPFSLHAIRLIIYVTDPVERMR